METISDRIKKFRTQRNMTQAALGQACGWSDSAQARIANYEKGREPSVADLRIIARELGISIMDLIEGNEVRDEIPDDEYAMIPQYTAQGSTGNGTMNEHVEVKGGLAFKKDWLARMRLRPQFLRVLYASGNSMLPTINDGDVLLLDESQIEPRNGHVFAILRPDGHLIVKRLIQHDLTGAWIIRSDNSDKSIFPDINASMHEMGEVAIVGRVVWHGGAL